MMQHTNLLLHGYSLILLVTILISNRKAPLKNVSEVIFSMIIYTTIMLIIFDYLSRLEGLEYTIYPILSRIGNFVIFLGTPMIPILWLIYIDFQIFSNKERIISYIKIFVVFFSIHAIMVIGTQFYGWFYTINEANVYERGPLFLLPQVLSLLIVFVSFALVLINRKRFERSHFISYLLFGSIPTFGHILQSLFYGVSYSLTAISISLVITYMNVQNKRMNVDYLTNLFNRRQLDFYILDKIKEANHKRKSFSVISFDLNEFKDINDTLGHQTGDEALKMVAIMLRKAVGSKGFIARFGGDEFYIITEYDQREHNESLMQSIEEEFQIFNDQNEDFKLTFSYGILVYQPSKVLSLEDIHRKVDENMYQMKNKNKKTTNDLR